MTNFTQSTMEQIVALSKRRGFVYQSSEIYGGIRGFWDYGPMGVLLKNNVRDWWWKSMVQAPPIGPDGRPVEVLGLDSAIIQHPSAWRASGHVDGFHDPMVDCRETKSRYRADHVNVYVPRNGEGPYIAFIDDALNAQKKIKREVHRNPDEYDVANLVSLPLSSYVKIIGPDTTTPGTLTEPRHFNLMLNTEVGAVDPMRAYLRPETAQGIFLNYKNVMDTARPKMPFGIAQIGKAFRNEVTPRNYIFRSREFEQMEMEFFCAPDAANMWFEFWQNERLKWWQSLGVSAANLSMRTHGKDELAHYSRASVDIEYKYPFTDPQFAELEGIAHRGTFDLDQHTRASGTKLEYFDQTLNVKLRALGLTAEEAAAKSRYVPSVIEPASGLTRAVLVMLCECYRRDNSRPSQEYLAFKPQIAPIKVGIFPLANKDGMPEVAENLFLDLRKHFMCEFDEKQSIGKRYARMDEVGTPFCITVDYETLAGGAAGHVTVRDRDSLQQQRVSLGIVKDWLIERVCW
jgi:glycyl-tRNA synthetase